MLRRLPRPLVALAAGAVIVAPSAAPALAKLGPPWISIELPANPYDQATRGAFLVVHAFHHDTGVALPVSGTAEGIVNGERWSMTLTFSPTSRPGVYTLARQWPTEGTWTLVITASQSPDDGATALVELAGDGSVASVRVPTERRSGWETAVPRRVSAADVTAALRQRVAAVGTSPRVERAAGPSPR